MAQQTIDTTTNHGSYIGDTATTAFGKVNANDTELYSRVAATETVANKAKSDITASGINVISAPQINPNQQQPTSLAAYNPGSTDSSSMPTNGGFGTLVSISFTPGQFTQLATAINTPVMAFRNYNNAWAGWYYLWHTGNTTVDANLFIKKAS